jgi:hypothetical protein
VLSEEADSRRLSWFQLLILLLSEASSLIDDRNTRDAPMHVSRGGRGSKGDQNFTMFLLLQYIYKYVGALYITP